jgi:hypothetical protein
VKRSSFGFHKHKSPSLSTGAFMLVGTLTMTYFHAVYPALSSALRRFTVLFGMGRRGPNALWSSENSAVGDPLSASSNQLSAVAVELPPTNSEEVKLGSMIALTRSAAVS